MVKSTKHGHLSCHTVVLERILVAQAATPSRTGSLGRPRRLVLAGTGMLGSGALGLLLSGLSILSGLSVLAILPTRAIASVPQSAGNLGHIGFGGSDTTPHTPPQHMVQGTVQDKEGKALGGAIVYLKNARNSVVEMVVADEKGGYRFSPLAADTDYVVWAQIGGKKGPTRPISAFSTGPLTMQLKVE